MSLTDFHSHILPGIDDGSQSVEESLQMLRLARQQGVTRMVATPHFYPHRDDVHAFLQRRGEAFAKLKAAMEQETDLPEIVLGAEVYYYPGISDSEEMKALTLGSKPYILVELPFAHWSSGVFRDLERLYTQQGLIPVIAHLDRYLRPFSWRKKVGVLGEMPVMIQVNGESFLDRRYAGWMLEMLRKGQIQAIGSDCHNLTDRAPNLGPVTERIRRKLGQSALDTLAQWAEEML